MGCLDIIECMLAAVAIVISIVVAVCDFRINCKINKLNMEAEIYQKVFFDYLINKIPRAQQNIKNTVTGLTGTDLLEEELNNLRQEALFFLYEDEAFYKELCKKLQDLEDTVIKANDKKMDETKYHMFIEDVKESIKDVYVLVMKKYEGLR